MSNYGLLDPRPLNEEEILSLKCETCGLNYDNADCLEDYNHIEETGNCIDCYKNLST